MSRNWLRACTLSLSGSSTLSIPGGGEKDLRIEAAIAASTIQTPNPSRFRITNPNPQTIASFKNKEFQRIEWSAGYQDNVGLIFSGDIKQSLYAHSENVVDSYLDVWASDGGNAYQQARVGATLSAGWTPRDKVNLALAAMQPFGISGLGLVNVDLDTLKYPRGRPFIGMARDLLREVALSNQALWSMHGGKVDILNHDKPVQSGDPVYLTSQSGLIGWPQQTENGIVARCLINPAIRVNGQVKIDESSIVEGERDNNPLSGPGSTRNKDLGNTGRIAADGLYRVLFLEVEADTRGQPWYMTLTCIALGSSPNDGELQTGYY